MDIISYNNTLEKEWDKFVMNASRNGCIFHTQRFLSYHHKGKFVDNSLLFRNKEINAVFPACLMDNGLRSHAGSSFGGLVISKDIGIECIDSIIENLCTYAQDYNLSYVDMTLTPYIYNTIPSEEVEFLLVRKGYKLAKMDLACALPLTENNFRNSTFRSVKSAISNNILIVFDDSDFDTYWKILDNNLRTKHNAVTTHTLDEIKKLKKMFPDKVLLVSAYYNGNMIAGAVIIIGNDNSFEVFYMAQNYDYQNLRSMNLIIYDIYMWGSRNQFKFMNLGVSTENQGKDINWSLFHFKEGFNGRGVIRKTFHKDLR